MKLKSSDIFEEYARIALEKGIISNAADEDKEDKSEKPTSSKKEDKQELSSAEIFYGVKTKPLKELLDEAHPTTVVMGPSYDKFNGVVENLHQRSNVMQHAALKNPPILQTNYRYVKATQDLIDETVKLGFYLDNLNNTKLMALADACTEVLNKTAEYSLAKLANPVAMHWGVKLVLGLLGAAAVTGVVSSNVYTSQGIKNDIENFIEELNEAYKKYPKIKSFFVDYVPKLQLVKDKIEELEIIGDEIKRKQIQALRSTNKKVQAKEYNKLAKYIVGKGIDKSIKRKSKELSELLDNVIQYKDLLFPILEGAEERYSKPTSTFEQWAGKVKEQVVQSESEDVSDILGTITEKAEDYKQVVETNLKNIQSLTEKFKYSKEFMEDSDEPEFSDEEDEFAEESLSQKIKKKQQEKSMGRRPSMMDEDDMLEDKPIRKEKTYYRNELVEAFK